MITLFSLQEMNDILLVQIEELTQAAQAIQMQYLSQTQELTLLRKERDEIQSKNIAMVIVFTSILINVCLY
jgi:hypothetical protein